MFKKTCINLFIGLILLQSGGVSLYHLVSVEIHKSILWSGIKRDIKAGRSHEKLEIYTEAQLKSAIWEDGKEFYLGNEKYDVMIVKEINGVKHYHCINDRKEEQLKNKLDAGKKSSKVFEEIIKKICLQTLPISSDDQNNFKTSENKFILFSDKSCNSGYLSESLKPPIA